MSTTEAVFDGWQLIGTSPLGGRWKITDVSGWVSKSMRRDRLARTGSSGSWPTTGLQAGRDIVITGEAVYGNPVSMATERRQFLALGGQDLANLTIVDAAHQLTAFVETDGITAPPVRDTMFTWSLTLHAPDPLLYGPALATSTTLESASGTGRVWPRVWPRDWGVPAGETPGGVIVPNNGTAPYWPVLRIDGPVPNPVLTLHETGDWVRIEVDLAAGQWLDIDCGMRRVLLNGQLSLATRVTFSGKWLAIPLGGGSLTWSADAADPAALLTVNHVEGAFS